MTPLAAPVLDLLINEDLCGVPGPLLASAQTALAHEPHDQGQQLVACIAALAAGEPKRALRLLAPSLQTPRVTAAVTVWARQLDDNWYPGGVGAETVDPDNPVVEPKPGEPLEELLEQVVGRGPLALAPPRALLENALRQGQQPAVWESLAIAARQLTSLSDYATAQGLHPMVGWSVLAMADMAHRAGQGETARTLLADARQQFSTTDDSARLALTHLVEGDWYAAPGTSAEALGWDLAPQPAPSPLFPADYQRAQGCYTQAASLAGPTGPPRLLGSLALRQAFLAAQLNSHEERREHLDRAATCFHAAGDAAGQQLTAAHRLIADIDNGHLAQHALDLGGGWHRPVQGPVAGILDWAGTVGSRSWGVGLGRLLQRCAERWDARGDATRARIGYVSAYQLISADSSVPAITFVTEIANNDTKTNLSTNALLRLERAFGPAFEQADLGGMFDFPQRLEATYVMISTLRDLSRRPAAFLAADRMTRLQDQVIASCDALRATLPPAPGPIPETWEELQTVLATMHCAGSLEDLHLNTDLVTLMQHFQLNDARTAIDTAGVLGHLIRADAFRAAGQLLEADRWYQLAIEAADQPHVPAHLLPIALIGADDLDQARLAMAQAADQLPDEFQLPLWLRVKDYERAADALARLEQAGTPPASWRDLGSVAELKLAQGETPAARETAQRAVDDFESSVRRLLRDPDRLEACDQPDVAGLFTTLALTYISDKTEPSQEESQAAFDAVEHLRSLSDDDPPEHLSPDTQRSWQLAAAEYAAFAGRLLPTLQSASPAQQAEGFARLDDLDRSLSAAEHTIESEDPGILVRRARPAARSTARQVQEQLPDGTLLLHYVGVGDDLLAWGMTRDALRPVRQSVRQRDLTQLIRDFHAAAADGRAPASELTTLLTGPFTDLLGDHDRVVVAPFGPLNLVPFHALPVDGTPLAMTHVVSYAQRAASAGRAAEDRPARSGHPLVVGDPAFDRADDSQLLVRLPGAQAEAAAVAEVLGVDQDRVLVGQAASKSAVSTQLESCDLLHVSSHGHLDDLSPFASSLLLAGTDELRVADFAGLQVDTDLAVLTGCDTGRGSATLGGDVVGFTRALLRSGFDRTVVSLWPIDDWVAPILMASFYRALASGRGPAHALALAQRALYAMSFEEMQAEYAQLGGTTSTTRRGIEPDPELRDDEEIPEPLDGTAERYWAPFILVE